MKPAFSVLFLTTLIGAAQGLFLALVAADALGLGAGGPAARALLVLGGGVAVVLAALGLVASFFHLGRPERAWRTATMWRTSWLSREVIVLPLFIALAALWALGQALDAGWTAPAGALAALAAAALFVCTAMVYASVRFLQEWASSLTLANYTLAGLASGCTAATALAAWAAPPAAPVFGGWALATTLGALVSRCLTLARNARLAPRSTVQTAIGIRHPRIVQRAQGFVGRSFNTREFFHGASAVRLRQVKWGFLLGAFIVPLALLGAGAGGPTAGLAATAFGVQYLGLLAERWFFFAEANHPQNLYYRSQA